MINAIFSLQRCDFSREARAPKTTIIKAIKSNKRWSFISQSFCYPRDFQLTIPKICQTLSGFVFIPLNDLSSQNFLQFCHGVMKPHISITCLVTTVMIWPTLLLARAPSAITSLEKQPLLSNTNTRFTHLDRNHLSDACVTQMSPGSCYAFSLRVWISQIYHFLIQQGCIK